MTKEFARFVRRERLSEVSLWEAAERLESGSVDAELGSGLVKQRVARVGAGKSAGYRTLIAFRRGDRTIFMFGFAKNEQASVSRAFLEEQRFAAKLFLSWSDERIAAAVSNGEWEEIRR